MNAPDLENLHVPTVRKPSNENEKRKLKKHKCPYCEEDSVHLKVHLKRKHMNVKEVVIMLKESKLNPGSREPMKKMLAHGDLQYNTNADINRGDLRVARIPKIQHKPEDYIPCANCKKLVLEENYRKHRANCLKEKSDHTRNLGFEGRAMWPYCSKTAKNRMRQKILPIIRKDCIKALIVRDELIIRFGNELCTQYRGVQHVRNIITKLRRLGRLKKQLAIKNLEEMYTLDTAKVVEAIETFAIPDEEQDSEFYKRPTVARNFQTLVKEVTEAFISMCIKHQFNFEVQAVENWQKTFLRDFRVIVSRTAGESKKINDRLNDKEEVPDPEDIEKLYNFLVNNIRICYKQLINEEEYDQSVHLKFLKLTLIYLQITNRRRPGDVERIFEQEFLKMKNICDENARLYGELDPETQDVAKEWSILKTRGILNNIFIFIRDKPFAC